MDFKILLQDYTYENLKALSMAEINEIIKKYGLKLEYKTRATEINGFVQKFNRKESIVNSILCEIDFLKYRMKSLNINQGDWFKKFSRSKNNKRRCEMCIQYKLVHPTKVCRECLPFLHIKEFTRRFLKTYWHSKFAIPHQDIRGYTWEFLRFLL